MAASIDPMIMCKIIGDVVDLFVPTTAMNVYYGNKNVTNGCTILPSNAEIAPIVTIGGMSHELYTLVMTDPDAPSPSEPSMREWVHWIVTNIPGGSNVAEGDQILEYTVPCPAIGIHRYILVLYRQSLYLDHVDQDIENPNLPRANFNTRAFAHRHCLGLPVATVYFNSLKETIKQLNAQKETRKNF